MTFAVSVPRRLGLHTTDSSCYRLRERRESLRCRRPWHDGSNRAPLRIGRPCPPLLSAPSAPARAARVPGVHAQRRVSEGAASRIPPGSLAPIWRAPRPKDRPIEIREIAAGGVRRAIVPVSITPSFPVDTRPAANARHAEGHGVGAALVANASQAAAVLRAPGWKLVRIAESVPAAPAFSTSATPLWS